MSGLIDLRHDTPRGSFHGLSPTLERAIRESLRDGGQVMLLLNRIGILSIEQYWRYWRMAILVIFVISMVLTPADPVSMLFMAVPLAYDALKLAGAGYLLYLAWQAVKPGARSPLEPTASPPPKR